jgi:quinol monooxygenase YgiN
MSSRSKFLPAFYYGPVWKECREEANDMLANNDNVYLLKPLTSQNGMLKTGKPIKSEQLKMVKGIAVIDFYIANTKLDKLIALFSENYIHVLKDIGFENYTLWVSELIENDFPKLPVFQDKNLLVAFSFYANEKEYQAKQKLVEAVLSKEVKAAFQDIVTIKSSLILYSTGTS